MSLKAYIYPLLSSNVNLPEFTDPGGKLFYSHLPKNEQIGTVAVYDTNKNLSFNAMNCREYAFEYRLRIKVISEDAKKRDDLGTRVINEVLAMEDTFLRQINFVTDDSFFNEFTDWYEWTIDFNIYIDN